MTGPRAVISSDMVARLDCPVLVVVGGTDVIGGSAQGLADLIPGAKAVELEGRDHMRTVGDRKFKEAVLAFLKERP